MKKVIILIVVINLIGFAVFYGQKIFKKDKKDKLKETDEERKKRIGELSELIRDKKDRGIINIDKKEAVMLPNTDIAIKK